MAGPLDEFVARIGRMVTEFAQEHGLEQAELRIELADGSRYLVATTAADPGFGFFSITPHRLEGEEPRLVVVPIGAVKSIEISAPDPERRVGFTPARPRRSGVKLQPDPGLGRSHPRYCSSRHEGTGASSSSVRPPFGSA